MPNITKKDMELLTEIRNHLFNKQDLELSEKLTKLIESLENSMFEKNERMILYMKEKRVANSTYGQNYGNRSKYVLFHRLTIISDISNDLYTKIYQLLEQILEKTEIVINDSLKTFEFTTGVKLSNNIKRNLPIFMETHFPEIKYELLIGTDFNDLQDCTYETKKGGTQ